MIKRFAYIVLLLLFAPCISLAKLKNNRNYLLYTKLGISLPGNGIDADTVSTKNGRKQEQDDKKKVKEVAKVKKAAKAGKNRASGQYGCQKDQATTEKTTET